MSDGVLTQEEIDALLASYAKESNGTSTKTGKKARSKPATGSARSWARKAAKARKKLPLSQRSLKEYDFSKPDKFSKEQLRTLQLVHETFGRNFATTLSAQVRSPVRIDVDSCVQCTYEEFLGGLNAPTSLYMFTASPLEGRMILEFSAGMSLTIVNRLLGGPWRQTNKDRDLTEIEHGLMRSIVMRAMQGMRVAWRSITSITCELVGYESDTQFAQILAPNDTVCHIAFSMHMGGFMERMNLCIPFSCLQTVVDKLNPQQWFMDPTRYSALKQNSQKANIDEAELPVAVELGTTTATMRELLDLEVGDIIKLDTKSSDTLTIYIGNIPKFLGVPGISGKKGAVRIVDLHPAAVAETDE